MCASRLWWKRFVEKASFEPGNDSETCVIDTCWHATHHTPTRVIHHANHTDFCWWSRWVVLLTDNIMSSVELTIQCQVECSTWCVDSLDRLDIRSVRLRYIGHISTHSSHTHTHTHTHTDSRSINNIINTITLGIFIVGPSCRPWPPAPPGDRLWQTLIFFRNRNVEPSSYPYTSTEWYSDMPIVILGYYQFVVPNGTRRTDT